MADEAGTSQRGGNAAGRALGATVPITLTRQTGVAMVWLACGQGLVTRGPDCDREMDALFDAHVSACPTCRDYVPGG